MTLNYSAPIVYGGSFTWGEYAYLPQAKQYATPTEQQKKNAIILFTHLQPLREELGLPLIISSGARTPAYTRLLRSKGIPAATQSSHMDWAAVDLICPAFGGNAKQNAKRLYDFMNKRWKGRIELLAYTPTWVHLDIKNWGKMQRFVP